MTWGWNIFPWVAVWVALCSLVGAVAAWRNPKRSGWAVGSSAVGLLLLGLFIVGLWITLQRPPLRTMGETRLWYSFFLLGAGLFTYLRWHFRWILSFSTLLASVFMLINILRPEIHDQTLMPALQSPWFVPHVATYMFSYALLGCATLLALWGLFRPEQDLQEAIHRLLIGGVALFTVGMLSGALWAKEAWGAYWSWDPKEAWAAATWGLYLLALHHTPKRGRGFYALLLAAFLSLQMCWYGVNYLPSAQNSAHTYNQTR